MTFNTSDIIEITLNTGIDLSVGITPRIRWKSPISTTGYFTATIKEGNKLYYKSTNTDFTLPGDWEFRASIVIDADEKLGEPVIKKFVTP